MKNSDKPPARIGGASPTRTATAELTVSINTVNFQVRNIHDKLQIHCRSETVARAPLNRLVCFSYLRMW